MPKYVLTRGKHSGFTQDKKTGQRIRKVYVAGDVITLDESAAACLQDKLISIEEHDAQQKVAKAKHDAEQRVAAEIAKEHADEQARALESLEKAKAAARVEAAKTAKAPVAKTA